MNYWYVEKPSGKFVYGDNELTTWDRERGLPVPVKATRAAKEAALAVAVKNNPITDPKNPPAPVKAAADDLKTTYSAEVATHAVNIGQDSQKPPEQMAGATYIATWDGVAPYVVTVLGAFPKNGISFMGWPGTDVPPAPPVPLTPENIPGFVIADG